MEITPAPHSFPIVCGLQHQSPQTRGWRPSGTKDWLMVATLEGLGYVRAEDTSWQLRRGDLLLIAPDTPQEYGHLDEQSRWTNIWVHFRPRAHWLSWLDWPQVAKGVMILQAVQRFEEIEAELRRMVDVRHGPLRLRRDAAMNALERVLIAADDQNPAHASASLDGRIRKALEIVGENLADPISIDQLSRAVGLSRSRFTVLFTEQVNLSPQAYVELTRLNWAAQMLTLSSWPVSQIAAEAGFPSPFYFSTRFRRHFGVPPTRYRGLTDLVE